ncbi:hypothetical protein NC653_034268 [Populus alba x Populus x berolinensis]|uniref:Uncharacterized protein n=1 Tax=Populus alba x Populus x berolinensis TaxID=444605 RepID=A0AAD6PW18_9ROSI|nr:hypothetical protein NC653_034268 [Populus alba x Populus x berolinensis]
MTIGVDEEPSKEVLKRIREIPAVEEFVFLKLAAQDSQSSGFGRQSSIKEIMLDDDDRGQDCHEGPQLQLFIIVF